MSPTCATLGRPQFAAGAAIAVLVFWLGIRGSEAALPWMAEVLAPRGINAGLALNVIWLALVAAFVGTLMWLIAARLRDRGRASWWALGWAVAATLPLALLALLNDAIVLVSKTFVLPTVLQWPMLIAAGAASLWVLAECLFGPSQQR